MRKNKGKATVDHVNTLFVQVKLNIVVADVSAIYLYFESWCHKNLDGVIFVSCTLMDQQQRRRVISYI